MLKLAGTASILVGLCHMGIVGCGLLMPAQQRAQWNLTPHEFWSSLLLYPTAHLTIHWLWAASGLLGLAVVPAIAQLLRSLNPAWVQWTSALAYLGFAVSIRGHFLAVAWDHKIIATYHLSDPVTQATLQVMADLTPEASDGLLSHGTVGFWVLVTSLLALRRKNFPRAIAWSGIATATLYGLGIVGYALRLRPLFIAAFVCGGLIGAPIWFIGLGLYLHRYRRPSLQAPYVGTNF